ncbi:helix-turn-helix domain-containing protein [Nocardioides sp. GCM10028917]|uniref:MmyB family transcriptional regulator n=1 Tax=Nocardioides sp. GCM10028917 TaxID=3273408 RepID=UPI003609AF75
MDEQTPEPGKVPDLRVDNRTEVRDFLTSRRGRITPEQAGLPLYGTNRRVTGLRREEVALLAGVSTDYYTRLERGNLSGVSESVLEALAAALKLDESERTHLFDLARAANTGSRQRRSAPKQHLREGVQRILDTIGAPAYVRNNRLDLLGSNRLGHALLVDLHGNDPAQQGTAQRPNLARYMFLDERSRDFYVEWAAVAKDVVSALRIEAGRNPYDRGLSDLVGELSTRSDDFRTWWATHNVRLHRTSTKQMRHPVAGDLELTGEALDLPADTGLTIITYTVEPNSASEQALNFLASWTDQHAPTGNRATGSETRGTAADTPRRSGSQGSR